MPKTPKTPTARAPKIEMRPCHVCDGTGEVQLEDYLADVLRICKVSEKSPQFVAEILDLTDQAANNLLKKLKHYGLVTRRAVKVEGGGRAFVYLAVRHGR